MDGSDLKEMVLDATLERDGVPESARTFLLRLEKIVTKQSEDIETIQYDVKRLQDEVDDVRRGE